MCEVMFGYLAFASTRFREAPTSDFALGPRLLVCVKFLFEYMLFENISFLDMTCPLDTLSVPRGCWTGRNPTPEFAFDPGLIHV